MLKYVPLVMLTACGIGSTMEGIKSEIGSMKTSVSNLSDNLASTGSAIKSQGVAMALGECMKSENLQYINLSGVIPSSIIPCSKAFGEMATEEQIAGLAYLWFIDLNQGTVEVETQEQQKQSDIFKLRRLMILESIAGMLTEEKTKAVHNLMGGQYESAVMGLMALRYQFISTFLLETGILAKDHPNQTEIASGYASIQSLKTLEALADGTGNYEIRLLGFFSPDLNQTIAVENKSVDLEQQLRQKENQNVRVTNGIANL
jgi:hypothetical protein